jgi:uncharacterized phage-associated protein
MIIQFPYNEKKALQTVAYFLRRANGPIDKAKLMKLVYLADRANFIEHGAPITGDTQKAMKLGPVPSNTLSLIDGEYFPVYQDIYDHIQLVNVSVSLVKDPGNALLSRDEQATLDAVWTKHGHKPTIPFCYETHKLPEYVETFVEGTSTPIPYETIAQYSGNPARFRLGRPVISPEMAEKMPAPFPPERNLHREF